MGSVLSWISTIEHVELIIDPVVVYSSLYGSAGNESTFQIGWGPGVVNGVAIMDAPKQAIAQMTWWGASVASNFTVSVMQTIPDSKATKVVLRIRNNSAATRQAIAIALHNLPRGVELQKATGVTRCALPAGSPYLDIGNFSGYETQELTLLFTVPDGAPKTVGFAPRMLQGLKPR